MIAIFHKRLATVMVVIGLGLGLLGMTPCATCHAQDAPMPDQPGYRRAPAPRPGTPQPRQRVSRQGVDYMAKLSMMRPSDKPMPVVVTPWYHWQGPLVRVGKYSIKLASKDPKVVLGTISEMSRSWSDLRVEAMFVAAIRLYDLGLKDDAFYWFHAAKHRSLLVMTVLAPNKKIIARKDPTFELQMGFGALSQQAGTYINGHAFGDMNKAVAIIQKVQNAGRTVPDLAKAYPELTFIKQAAWEKKNQEALDVLNKLIDHVRKNAEQIRAERIKNGIEGKY